MGDETTVVELGERVAALARTLNIETIVIGAYAMVVELLRQNPDADVEVIRATCKRYALDKVDELIDYARSGRR